MANSDVEARRKQRQKIARKKHLKTAFVIFLIFALSVCVVLSVTVLFPIKTVKVTGSNIYSSEEIAKKSQVMDKNLFTVSKEKTEKRIRKSLPFVDKIEFVRSLPDTIQIKVTDAKEYASYLIGNTYFTVSKNGNVLNKYNKLPEKIFEIKSKSASCEVGGTVTFKDNAEKEIIDTLISEIESTGEKIDFVDVTNKNDIKMGVSGRFTVLFGVYADIDKKCAHLKSMIKNIAQNESGTINLSMWSSEKREGTFIKNTGN